MKKLLSLLLVCALLCGCSEQAAQTTTTTTTASTTTTTTTSATTTTPQATTTTTTPQTTTTPETTTTSEPIQTEPVLGLSYTKKDDMAVIAENYEYSEDDKDLQALMAEKQERINMYLTLEKFGYYATVEDAEKDGVEFSYETEIEFEGTPIKILYVLQNDEIPFNSIDEVKADINSLFAEDIANEKIANYFESKIPLLEEKDGRLYHKASDGSGGYTSYDFSKSKVISKTEDEIVFSFLMPEVADNVLFYNAIEGILKYEDNEWKVAFSLHHPEWHDFSKVWVN